MASTVIQGLSALYIAGQMARFCVMFFQEKYGYINRGGDAGFLMGRDWGEVGKDSVVAGEVLSDTRWKVDG